MREARGGTLPPSGPQSSSAQPRRLTASSTPQEQSPGGPARRLSEAEAGSHIHARSARRGRLSLPGRSRAERRKEAQCSGQHRQANPTSPHRPFLPRALPNRPTTHTNPQGGQGDPQRPWSPSSVSAPAPGAEGRLSAECARVEKGNQCR